MSKDVIFNEDLPSKFVPRMTPVPKKGLEEWIYKMMPGKDKYKKLVLFFITLIFFGAASYLFMRSVQNLNELPDEDLIYIKTI